jgi:hypothetical protein
MKITWSLPGHSGGGTIDQDVLNTALPADKDYEEAGVCYGHYVRAVESVLQNKEGEVVPLLMKGLFPESLSPVISIHVEILKHGHFYHPARMTLSTDDKEHLVVINLAVTPEGGACAGREFALLGALSERSEALPKVHALKTVVVGGHTVVLFFGAWFEGFHEFHQTRRTSGDEVVVWADAGHQILSKEAETSVYRQAAEILTRLYNPFSFELVQPWHHAAGDFVVNCESFPPLVKLITVRQYLPMAEVEAPDGDDVLEGALVFLMLLSIRNRLDRYDGIGEVAWVGDHGVAATIEGFFDGMAEFANIGSLVGALGPWVERYLASHTEEDLWETALTVVSSFNPKASEMGVVKENLAKHVAVFYRVLQGRRSS